MTDQTIANRLQIIQEQIANAAVRSGRAPAAVQLIAVSKGHPVDAMQAAMAAGQLTFGENYLEEAIHKMDSLPADTEWHMTGHVQSRKAAIVAARFAAVHSVDRLALAQRFSRFCEEHGKFITLFLECNVSGEKTKYGFEGTDPDRWPDLFPVWQTIGRLPGMRIAGLMTMAPFNADPQTVRSVFRMLRNLQNAARKVEGLETLIGLSMGMSDDFETAIEEGATVVRIGRAIFGPRTTAFSR